jgi:Uma2 family endonuclease
MSANPNPIVTVDEYLDLDENSENRYEYFDGYVIAMAQPSINHTRITRNLTTAIDLQLKGRDCEVYSSTLRVLIESTGARFYPDVAIVGGAADIIQERGDSILNPVILIEVLSPSNAYIDTGKKLIHYRKIPSLKEYLVVGQHEHFIGHHHMQSHNDLWDYGEYMSVEDVVHLHSVKISITVRDIYDRVIFG